MNTKKEGSARRTNRPQEPTKPGPELERTDLFTRRIIRKENLDKSEPNVRIPAYLIRRVKSLSPIQAKTIKTNKRQIRADESLLEVTNNGRSVENTKPL